MLTTFINTLMSAEADAVCGAEYGARSAEGKNMSARGRIKQEIIDDYDQAHK
jgi:transposase-like protein